MQWHSNRDEADPLVPLRRRAIPDVRLQPVLDCIANTAARLMGTPAAVIALRTEQGLCIQSSFGLNEVTIPECLRLGSTSLPFESDANSSVVVADLTPDASIGHAGGEARYYASVPLRTTGGLYLGVLAVMDTRPRAVTSPELMSSLESLAVLLVQQWELLAQLKDKEGSLEQCERDLVEERERWRLAVEANSDGLFDCEYGKGSCYFSPRWKQILGYGDDEIPPRREEWLNRIHPADMARVEAELQTCIRGAKLHCSMEYRMHHRDGHWLWIQTRARAVRDEAGQLLRLIGVNSDITGTKEFELRLIEAKEAAESASRSKGDFLAIMSHEI